MSNIWRLFVSDLRQLTGNIVTILAVLGLVALPSIFSWYNIIACWDVFGNTGNLTVAVANSDEGYTSDLVPLEVNVGDKVVAALRENDQLNWVFTNESDAIDGVSAGRYYAAVVIPPTFSRDMMSFYSSNVEHAKITYYSNQKKSAIAPKVTDQGADQVSNKVNTAFAETISEIAIGLSSALANYADQADASGRMGTLAQHINEVGNQLDDSSAALASYSSIIGSTQSLISNATDLLTRTKAAAEGTIASAREAKDAAQAAVDKMQNALTMLRQSLDNATTSRNTFTGSIETAFSQADAEATEAENKLRNAAARASERGLTRAAQRLTSAADEIHAANVAAQTTRTDARNTIEQARAEIDNARANIDSALSPKIDAVAEIVSNVQASISRATATLDETSGSVLDGAAKLSTGLGNAKGGIDDAATKLSEGAATLKRLSSELSQALESNDLSIMKNIIGSDPDTLAAAISSPVDVNRIPIYPVENFGSAMSPLYTTLALWIGALLIMVTLKTRPSAERLNAIGNPTSRQIFMGRFLVVALISLMQSTLLSVGNLFFLGVQAVHPLLYVVCFWVAGLAFAFIMYTMVALFANLGKALGVVLLIVQVGGGGGSFPLPLLPPFFQAMSPFLPIAHAVRAMRAAMFGVYAGDFWIEIGTLILFTVPLAILGLVLNEPLGKIVPKFIERVEQSKLM